MHPPKTKGKWLGDFIAYNLRITAMISNCNQTYTMLNMVNALWETSELVVQ